MLKIKQIKFFNNNSQLLFQLKLESNITGTDRMEKQGHVEPEVAFSSGGRRAS